MHAKSLLLIICRLPTTASGREGQCRTCKIYYFVCYTQARSLAHFLKKKKHRLPPYLYKYVVFFFHHKKKRISPIVINYQGSKPLLCSTAARKPAIPPRKNFQELSLKSSKEHGLAFFTPSPSLLRELVVAEHEGLH